METCDVLVIGHGLAGAAVAYEMQPFASVVLVERAPPAPRSALLLPTHPDTIDGRLAAASRTFYAHQAGVLAGRPVAVPLDLLQLVPAGQPDQQPEATLPTDAGEPVEAAEIVEKLPFLASSGLAGGRLVADALDLDTGALHQAYHDTFTARGGRLVSEAEPLAIDGDSDGDGAPWRISCGRARFETKVLVDATGPFVEEVALAAGLPPLGLLARRQTMLRFEAAAPPPAGMPLIASPDHGLLLKPAGDAFVAIVTDPEPVELMGAEPGRDDRAGAIARIETVTKLQVRHVLASTATWLVEAPDHAPVVGQDDLVAGFFWVAGEGPDGALAPALARAAASLLVSGVLPDDLIALKIAPEDLLPLRFREQRED